MSAATAVAEAPARVERVEDLADEVRKAIVAQREAGSTLAEIKKAHPNVAPDVIRSVLPPMNKREEDARQPKGKAATQPTTKPDDEPKVDPQVAQNLAERVVAARELPGSSRSVVATLTGLTPGKVWRVEQGRVRADEVAQVTEALDALERDGLPEEYRPKDRPPAVAGPTKAELLHRVEVVAALLGQAREHAKAGTKVRTLLDEALAVLEPPAAADPES